MDDFHRMVAEFMCEIGFDAEFIKQLPGVPDDNTGKLIAQTEEIPIRAIKMEAFGNMAGSRTKLGTLIQEADQVLYVQPTEYTNRFSEPLFVDPTTDRVRIKGANWKVVAVREYNPSANDCVLYELYIKK